MKTIYFYQELYKWIKDYINHYNHFPHEFEYEGIVYDIEIKTTKQ